MSDKVESTNKNKDDTLLLVFSDLLSWKSAFDLGTPPHRFAKHHPQSVFKHRLGLSLQPR